MFHLDISDRSRNRTSLTISESVLFEILLLPMLRVRQGSDRPRSIEMIFHRNPDFQVRRKTLAASLEFLCGCFRMRACNCTATNGIAVRWIFWRVLSFCRRDRQVLMELPLARADETPAGTRRIEAILRKVRYRDSARRNHPNRSAYRRDLAFPFEAQFQLGLRVRPKYG